MLVGGAGCSCTVDLPNVTVLTLQALGAGGKASNMIVVSLGGSVPQAKGSTVTLLWLALQLHVHLLGLLFTIHP